MGDNVSIEESKHFQNSVKFIQVIQDPVFGSIDIYRMNEPPYQYILDYKKTFMQGDSKATLYLNKMLDIKKKQHKNLVKVHHCECRQDVHMCIKDRKVHTFCNYYNFTLTNAIDKKKRFHSKFTQSQLIYIMSSILDVALHLKKYNISIGDYRTEKIYLSPQGYIKLYLLQIQDNNQHSNYYKALTENSQIEFLVLAPQQFKSISNLDYQMKYDLYKADLFAISMVILQLIVQDKIKFYYNESRTAVKMARIEFDISSFKSFYSDQFLELLKACLQQDPKKRISMEQAYKYLMTLKSRTTQTCHCIRLQNQQEPNSKSKTTTNQDKKPQEIKNTGILNRVDKKLTPSPISTLNSSTITKFQTPNIKYHHKYH